MKLMLWVAVGALLAALPAVHAQPPSRTPEPADPTAPVPPLAYQSALTGYAPAPKDAPSPDKAWRAANETVSRTGHGAQHAAPSEPRKVEAQRPATPAAPSRDHRKHH